ncbi:MAG: hypothetical protein BroJett013_25270 [Alphaproteobacteria bacterium]|nr:MAG: hypothetical protein BroJett013_25270 [Alphaproteobacteria bacterium]
MRPGRPISRACASRLRQERRRARPRTKRHTEIQGRLRDLGLALGYGVWVAQNDRGRAYGEGRLGDKCLASLGDGLERLPGADSVRLIDVLWLASDRRIIAAFEVEHTTSIYSGIVRMLDLALGTEGGQLHALFLVAPDRREADVRAQIARPAFSRIADLKVRYLPYSEVDANREAIARFGQGVATLEKISHALT